MLKRLATAGVLTLTVGGVMMNAAPAMASGHGHDKHHGKHHGHYGDYKSHVHNESDDEFDLNYVDHDEETNTKNETFAVLSCLQIPIVPIISPNEQSCYIGNVEND